MVFTDESYIVECLYLRFIKARKCFSSVCRFHLCGSNVAENIID